MTNEEETPDGTGGTRDGSPDTGPNEDGISTDASGADVSPETATGIFYVKHATDASATLHDVDTAQIFTLTENPGFEPHDIVEASLVAQPPMEVAYLVDELEAHYAVPVETSPEPPTRQVRDIAAEMDPTEAAVVEREGEGEIHILRVEPDAVEQTAAELGEDEMTHKTAASCGVERVEIRTGESGIVSVRYLP